MKLFLKFLAFLTLRTTLVRLAESSTVHFKETLDQMDKTRSAMIVLSGTDEQLVKSVHELITKKSHLEKLVEQLNQHIDLLEEKKSQLTDEIAVLEDNTITV